MLRGVALGLALALISGPVSAQVAAGHTDLSADPDVAEVEDVLVLGTATRRAMANYARTVGAGPTGRLNPRWNDRLCIRVINMDDEHATYLKARVETVAKAVGLSPNPSPDCRPDVSIYASNNPNALATTLVEAEPRGFQPAHTNVTLGRQALESFQASDAPIRWWHVSLPLLVDTGQLAIALRPTTTSDPMARSVAVQNGSRLRGNVRDDLVGVVIIVDIDKLNGLPFGAISDYVAFVALAPADPRSTTEAFDTVLNLFDRPDVSGLSPMDQDYLYALYTASRAPASAAVQTSEIANRMATERRRRLAAQR